MAIIHTIQFDEAIDNISMQEGDTVFAVQHIVIAGMDVSNFNPRKIGTIMSIDQNSIKIEGDDGLYPPGVGDFFFFVKDPVINTSSLKGYYADVTFTNDSKEKAELYAVSSEITESSK